MKSLSIVLLTCLFIISLFTSTVSARSYLLNTESSLTITADQQDFGTVTPETETVNTDITISYTVGRFARPQGWPLPRKASTTLNLSITSKPSWCTVSISQNTFQIPLVGFLQQTTYNVTAVLTAQINQATAPAYTPGTITILAEALENGNIQGSTQTIDLYITPEYIGGITATLSNSTLHLNSNEIQTILLNITNDGNARIAFSIDATLQSNSSFFVTVPVVQFIDSGNNLSTGLIIRALNKSSDDKKDETISIDISFYPVDDDSKLMSIFKQITVTHLGWAEEDKEVIDLTPFVIGIVVVFVVLFLIFSLIARRRGTWK